MKKNTKNYGIPTFTAFLEHSINFCMKQPFKHNSTHLLPV